MSKDATTRCKKCPKVPQAAANDFDPLKVAEDHIRLQLTDAAKRWDVMLTFEVFRGKFPEFDGLTIDVNVFRSKEDTPWLCTIHVEEVDGVNDLISAAATRDNIDSMDDPLHHSLMYSPIVMFCFEDLIRAALVANERLNI